MTIIYMLTFRVISIRKKMVRIRSMKTMVSCNGQGCNPSMEWSRIITGQYRSFSSIFSLTLKTFSQLHYPTRKKTIKLYLSFIANPTFDNKHSQIMCSTLSHSLTQTLQLKSRKGDKKVINAMS